MHKVDNSWVFPPNDISLDADISMLQPRNQAIYGDLLPLLRRGRTWCCLHFGWPETSGPPVPDGFDTYIFSWHLDPWPHQWLDEFCRTHSSQQVVVISDYDAEPKHENLKILCYHGWHVYVPWCLENFDQGQQFNKDRPYRLSSLCNKPSFFKALLTAYLLKNHWPSNDLLLSWNYNARQRYCDSMNSLYVDQWRARPNIHGLVEFYHKTDMSQRRIKFDDFQDSSISKLNHLNHVHPAFTHSLVNATNETYSQNQLFDTKLPGPFVGEKTWKTILGGCAILPVGNSDTYPYFESFGFNMEYPWPKEFDDTVGDLDRLEMLFDTVNWVLSEQCFDHSKQIMEINQQNYEHARSQGFIDSVVCKNHRSLETFLMHY